MSASTSVTSLLISSGMVLSKERRPASRCATLIPILVAAIVAAMVELTSPTTTTRSGLFSFRHLLIGHHYLAGLFSMSTAADSKINVRLREAEVFEKSIRHIRIIMLPGMDNNGCGPVLLLERVIQGRNFHEIGSCRTDEMYNHSLVNTPFRLLCFQDGY